MFKHRMADTIALIEHPCIMTLSCSLREIRLCHRYKMNEFVPNKFLSRYIRKIDGEQGILYPHT